MRHRLRRKTGQTIHQRARTAPTAWQHNGTWTIRGVNMKNEPTLGSELLTNTTFDSDTTNWTAVNSALASVAGGQSNNAMRITNSIASSGYAHQGVSTTAGDWLLALAYHKNGTAAAIHRLGSTSSAVDVAAPASFSDGVYALHPITGRALGSTTYYRLIANSGSAGVTTLFDEASVKKLTLNTLFAVRSGPNSPASVWANGTIVSGAFCGVVYGLDSISSPANCIIAIHDGGTAIRLLKLVSGTWTQVLSTTATYVSGILPQIKYTGGNTFQLFYGGTQRGADQTISDAGSGALHGVFNTYSGNAITGFFQS